MKDLKKNVNGGRGRGGETWEKGICPVPCEAEKQNNN